VTRTQPNRVDGLPFGVLATEIDRIGSPNHPMDRQWAWRDLLLEVTYLEDDARRYRWMKGAHPWTVPRGVWRDV
jgi:hypothetical protein